MKFLLFFLFPFLELYLWVQFIQVYSFADAFLLVVTTGLLGLFIMILQGRSALFSLQVSLMQGKSPERMVLHKAMVMFGGFLIFLPGLMTKTFGTLLILPGVRHLVVMYLRILLAQQISKGLFRFFSASGGAGGAQSGFQSGFYRWSSGGSVPQERDVVEVTPLEVTHQDVPGNVIEIKPKKDF